MSKTKYRYSVDTKKFIGLSKERNKYKSLKELIDSKRISNERIEKSRILKWFYQIACLNTTDLDQLNFNPSYFMINETDDIILLPKENKIIEFSNIHDCWSIALTLYELVTLNPLIEMNKDLDPQMNSINEIIDKIDLDFKLFKVLLRKMLLNDSENRITAKDLIKIIPKTNYLISGSTDSTIKIWNIFGEVPDFNLKSHSDSISTLLVFNSYFLASGSSDKTIKTWDLNTKEEIHTLIGHKDSINCLTFIEIIGLISGSKDGEIKVWDMTNDGVNIQTFTDHTGEILALIYLTNDRYASSSADKTIKIWNANGLVSTLEGHQNKVLNIISFQQDKLISCSSDSTIKIWNINSSELLKSFEIESNFYELNLTIISFDHFVSLSNEGDIKLWELEHETNALKNHKIGNDNKFKCIVRISDAFIAAVTKDNVVKLWNVKRNTLVNELTPPHDITTLAICQNYF